MAVHAEPHFVVWGLIPLALVVGVLAFCVLILFKKTRPLAWTLLGLGVLGVMFLFGYVSLSVEQVRMAPLATHAWPQSQHPGHPSDIDALLGPRIQLDGETVVMRGSAHPAQPTRPLELSETTEAAPPEPEDDDGHAPVTDDHVAAAPSASSDWDTSSSEASSAITSRRSSRASEADAGANESPPAWVRNPPSRDPQNYPVVVITDPFTSPHEADRQVSQLIMIATSEVISDLVGNYPAHMDMGDHAARYDVALEQLRGMGLSPGMLRSRVLQDDWTETLELDLPYGPMVRTHALLVFDQPFQEELQNRWREHQANERVGIIGVIVAGVIGLLSLVWGALKFDTATKGYYTKWLVGSAAVATIGLLAFFAMAISDLME